MAAAREAFKKDREFWERYYDTELQLVQGYMNIWQTSVKQKEREAFEQDFMLFLLDQLCALPLSRRAE